MKKRVLPTTEGFKLMHITIKATGKGHGSDRWIFNNRHKTELQEELKRFLKLFDAIDLIGFVWMSNHAHILVNIPENYHISRSEMAAKYHECYPKQPKIHPNSHQCQQLQKDVGNISKFMKQFEQSFARKFNQQQKFKRSGHLWQRRFHNTNLGDAESLLRCWVYIIFNPVKANMVQHPTSYKFSSYCNADTEFINEVLINFYELYKYLSGKESLSLDEFKELLRLRLQDELDDWNRKNEREKEHYRQLNHMWDQLTFIDKTFFYQIE